MRVCIPIRGKNFKITRVNLRKAEKLADFFEIWVDFMKRDELAEWLPQMKKQVIAVVRTQEGFEKVLFFGKKISFIDLDFEMKMSLLRYVFRNKPKRIKVILSYHNFKKTPSLHELLQKVKRAWELKADIAKIATFVKNWSDNVMLFEFTKRVTPKGLPLITVGIGEKGKISRIGCNLLGSFLTYVALDERKKTAPGQSTLKNFLWDFK